MKQMSLEEAKDFFFSMNCSEFMMARENLPQYKIYLNLNILKKTKTLWREEQLNNYYEKIKSDSNYKKSWLLYDNMYDLVESIKSSIGLTIMENTLKIIISKLSDKERIIVAETIIGRKQRVARSGLIYLSFDLGDKVKAKSFANSSLDLLNINSEDKDLLDRAENASLTCNEIINELAI